MKQAERIVRASALLLCALLCCALAGCGAAEADKPALSQLSFLLKTDGAREAISCFCDGGDCTVFLPSHASMNDLSVCMPETVDAELGGTVLSDGMTCGAFRTDTEYTLRIGDKETNLRFLQSQNVAALYVHTQSGSMDFVHAQKTNKEPAELLLVTADGTVAYRSAGTDTIRGRGNSTWSKAKKPYNLYLRTPADLLGMGASTEWALLANAFDETNLRNRMIFDFAQRVSGDARFAPDTAFTDVYLNGTYAGLYLLSEKPQIGEARLDISPDSMLFSWVQSARNDTFFALNSTISVEIESPDPCTNAAQHALEKELRAFADALTSGGNWQDCIDTDSFARKYLIEEVFGNYDLRNSQFFYREPGGRLFAGPCWDYDLSLGVSWRNTWSTPNGFFAQNRQDENETWYSLLWKQDAFRERVLTLFKTEYLPLLDALTDSGIAQQAHEIAAASRMNALRWRDMFGGRTNADAVDKMTDFLTRRVAFLRSAWVDGTAYCTLTLRHPVRYEYISVPPGTVCTQFPQPQKMDLPANTVWLREDTGEPFDPQSPITQDVTLVLPRRPKAIGRRTLLAIGSLAAMGALCAAASAAEAFRRRRRSKRAETE